MDTQQTPILMPVRKPVLIKSRLTVSHQVPAHAKVKVKVGDVVAPDTKIAEYETSWGYRVLHVATELKVSGAHVPKLLLKKVGDHVYQKEPLAKTASFLPFNRKTMHASVDGVIQSIAPNGDVTVSMPPEHIRQASLYWGTIKDIISSEQQIHPKTQDQVSGSVSNTITIVVDTRVLTVTGMLGSGNRREGRITVASDAADFLLPQRLEDAWKNCIIVAGALLEHGVLQKALRLQASGIITGGIHARDAMGMGIRRQDEQYAGTDVGITIVATEGFGAAAMNEEQFAMLVRFNGRYGVLNGNALTLEIPIKEDEYESLPVQENEPEIPEMLPLTEGQNVRIVTGDDVGRVGKVLEITQSTVLASGLATQMVKIELHAGSPNYNIVELQNSLKSGMVENQQPKPDEAAGKRKTYIVVVPVTNIEAIL